MRTGDPASLSARFTLLGVGAMNSPRYAPAGLLVEYGRARVAIDGGPGAEPDGPLAAWLVTDQRGELISGLRRLAAARGLTPKIGAYRASGLAITPHPVVHTSHPTCGYLIEADGIRAAWAPEFLEFPVWAAGTDLMFSWKPLPGAVAALHRLRTAGVPLVLVTNTTSRTRAWIASALAEAGFPVTAGDVLTAPAIAAAYLQDRYPGARCLLLNSGDIGEDLAGLTLAREGDQAPADVVLIGGAGPEFSYQALNQAFGHLQRGARLVAMHRGLYWRTDEGLQLDTGAFLAGLEQAAGTEAEVVGKPAPEFFAAALARLGAGAAGTVMVGDDIDTDVLAAQRQGLTGVLVKTGKYLPRAHYAAAGTPDHVLDSFAGLPALLERLS